MSELPQARSLALSFCNATVLGKKKNRACEFFYKIEEIRIRDFVSGLKITDFQEDVSKVQEFECK